MAETDIRVAESFDDMIDRSQAEGWCAVDIDEFCLTHQCSLTEPCGRLTCKHCHGEDGSGADANID